MASRVLKLGLLGNQPSGLQFLFRNNYSIPNLFKVCSAVSGTEDINKTLIKNNVKTFATPQEVIADKEINTVVVPTELPKRSSYFNQIIAHQKHFICQAPFVSTYENALKYVQEIEKSNLLFNSGAFWKYHPMINLIKEIIDSEIYGKMDRVAMQFEMPTEFHEIEDHKLFGSVIPRVGYYPIDFARYLLNDCGKVDDPFSSSLFVTSVKTYLLKKDCEYRFECTLSGHNSVNQSNKINNNNNNNNNNNVKPTFIYMEVYQSDFNPNFSFTIEFESGVSMSCDCWLYPGMTGSPLIILKNASAKPIRYSLPNINFDDLYLTRFQELMFPIEDTQNQNKVVHKNMPITELRDSVLTIDIIDRIYKIANLAQDFDS
eukprot:TRINITY_DN1287_c0_g1_i1.p1 TRINITY_DN1287_c0_g1~~TRINITY_DN1287_c0_g1_i1.p1  ORF type:complete len:374 (-),score=135.18 TRINITY_DN1287_c0_g1_i1:43-1164(-)